MKRQQPRKGKQKGGYFCLKAKAVSSSIVLPGKEKDRNLPDKRQNWLEFAIYGKVKRNDKEIKKRLDMGLVVC